MRCDLDSPGRLLVEHTHVEIAVDRHGSSTRDRSCRHHEYVGNGSVGIVGLTLGAQHRSLLDTEPMLFVDHDNAQVMETDPFLNESVRSDDDVDRTVRQTGQELAPLGPRHPIGE